MQLAASDCFETGYSEKNRHVVSVVGIGQCFQSGLSDSKSDVVSVVGQVEPFQTCISLSGLNMDKSAQYGQILLNMDKICTQYGQLRKNFRTTDNLLNMDRSCTQYGHMSK